MAEVRAGAAVQTSMRRPRPSDANGSIVSACRLYLAWEIANVSLAASLTFSVITHGPVGSNTRGGSTRDWSGTRAYCVPLPVVKSVSATIHEQPSNLGRPKDWGIDVVDVVEVDVVVDDVDAVLVDVGVVLVDADEMTGFNEVVGPEVDVGETDVAGLEVVAAMATVELVESGLEVVAIESLGSIVVVVVAGILEVDVDVVEVDVVSSCAVVVELAGTEVVVEVVAEVVVEVVVETSVAVVVVPRAVVEVPTSVVGSGGLVDEGSNGIDVVVSSPLGPVETSAVDIWATTAIARQATAINIPVWNRLIPVPC